MGNIFKQIEKAMIAATFAEANERDYARQLLNKEKNAHKKVLLSTNCPLVTDKVLEHSINLSKRLGASLEIYQLLSTEFIKSSNELSIKAGLAKLKELQTGINTSGISYQYTITDTTLMEELTKMAKKRRDILAVVIPTCETSPVLRKRSRQTLSRFFKCPVILFDS